MWNLKFQNGKFPFDGGDAVVIPLMASKERNLSRLWDSSEFLYSFAVRIDVI